MLHPIHRGRLTVTVRGCLSSRGRGIMMHGQETGPGAGPIEDRESESVTVIRVCKPIPDIIVDNT
jgi:hypothetical protein